jgi:hypothetical protein
MGESVAIGGGLARHAVSSGVCVQPHDPFGCRSQVDFW